MTILLGGLGAWLLGWSIGAGSRACRPGWARRAARTPARRVAGALGDDRDGARPRHRRSRRDGAGRPARRPAPRRARRGGAAAASRPPAAPRDPDGVRLLEAYLDRRFPGWREHAERDADAGPGARPQPGAMTEEEAYQVLGLEPGAGLGGDPGRAPDADEEAPSRPGGLDVSRGPGQPGQGHSAEPTSLKLHARSGELSGRRERPTGRSRRRRASCASRSRRSRCASAPCRRPAASSASSKPEKRAR